jgi:hypothetical protein
VGIDKEQLSAFLIKAPLRVKTFALLTTLYTAALIAGVIYGIIFETKTILYLVSGLSLIFSLMFWLNILACFLCMRYVRKLYKHGEEIGRGSFYIDTFFLIGFSAMVMLVSYFLLNVHWDEF